jgi:hypothetical protein
VLPEAVRAVGRLLLDGRVPPAVEVEDVVRGGEIETSTDGPSGSANEATSSSR